MFSNTSVHKKTTQHTAVDNLGYCAFFNSTKHAEYDFLSNFHERPIVSRFGTFRCAEGYYQHLKFLYLNDAALNKRFMEASGQEAWNLSRDPSLVKRVMPTWNREQAMRTTLSVKFADDVLRKKLLATQSRYLVENSFHGHDDFWSDAGDGKGQNKLGHLLMELRKKFGGEGVVPIPPTLQLFYSKKCDQCTNCCHFTNSGMVFNFCDAHMTHELKLGNFSKMIHLSDIPDGTGRFLYFKTNDIPELVEEGARLIAERILEKSKNNPNFKPFFVTPEASTYAIAHILRTKYGIPGVVINKSKKPTDIETFSVDYCAITSTEKKTLYLDKMQAAEMLGKTVFLFDNVCTTGETLRAVTQLCLLAGVNCKQIEEAIVLFTEGDEASSVKIAENYELKLHKFCHLPLFATDPSVDKSRYRLYGAATFPTNFDCAMTLAVFHHRAGNHEQDAEAFYKPTTFDHGHDDIVVRVHDACATSERFHSVKCDCREQLEYSEKYIAENGGIVIYLHQEGRGIGLGNKMRAYSLQEEQGFDTVQANRELGLPDDVRKYEAVPDILNALGVKSIKLMTNNPRKIACLEKLGIKVNGHVPCLITPQYEPARKYMAAKAAQMGHMIPELPSALKTGLFTPQTIADVKSPVPPKLG